MAKIIIETGLGLSTANSYCSVDNADIYHEKHLYASDWTSAGDDNKEIALMWATRLLDEDIRWNGRVMSENQALAWPRSQVYTINGHGVATDGIPQFLKDATAEFARCLIAEDRTLETNRDLIGFKEMKVGDLELKVDSFKGKPLIPPSVWSIVRPYGSKAGKKKTLVRM
jgi:hypothetical protein